MTKKCFLSMILLMLLFGISCRGQPTSLTLTDEVHSFEALIDAWMEPYRYAKAEEFDDWLLTMERTPMTAKKHPVFEYIAEFVTKHQDEYIRWRSADLGRYPQLGTYWLDYELAEGFRDEIRKELDPQSANDELNWMQELANYRTLYVSSLKGSMSIIQSSVFEYLSEHHGITLQDFSLSNICGEKVFVDKIDGQQFQVTFLNRLYALQCHWDIRTNRITIPDLYVYQGEKQPQGWLAETMPKANNSQQRITAKLESIVWGIYDEIEIGQISTEADILDKLDAHLQRFYQDNKVLYTNTRETLLGRYPDPQTEKWEMYRQEDTEVAEAFYGELQPMADKTGHALPLYAAVYDLDASNTALTIENTISWQTGQTYPNSIKQWFLGSEINAWEIETNLWEIYCFFDGFASRYVWNIATDEISELVIKRK